MANLEHKTVSKSVFSTNALHGTVQVVVPSKTNDRRVSSSTWPSKTDAANMKLEMVNISVIDNNRDIGINPCA